MPLAKLFVEGRLEAELLNPILQGDPLLQQGGSKYSLRPRAMTDRRENRVQAGYLRDRDFDFDPPGEVGQPTIDYSYAGRPVGWRWSRHEIENYLLEPSLVGEAMQWPIGAFESALRQSALAIRSYEAARWTVGIVRRALPPHYELHTRPDDLADIGLPATLDRESVRAWMDQNIARHRARIVAVMDPVAVEHSFDLMGARFAEAFGGDMTAILTWFSGKDLFAGLAVWLTTMGVANPGAFRAALRDWVIANPDRALDLLPEWRALVSAIRV